MESIPLNPTGLIRANRNQVISRIAPVAPGPKDSSDHLYWLNQVTVGNFITHGICKSGITESARDILKYAHGNHFLGLPTALAKCKRGVPAQLKAAAQELIKEASTIIREEALFINELKETERKAVKFAVEQNPYKIPPGKTTRLLPGSTTLLLPFKYIAAGFKSASKATPSRDSTPIILNDPSRLLPESLTEAINNFYSQLRATYSFHEPEYHKEMRTQYLRIKDGLNSIERETLTELRDPAMLTTIFDNALGKMQSGCTENESIADSLNKRFERVLSAEEYLQYIESMGNIAHEERVRAQRDQS